MIRVSTHIATGVFILFCVCACSSTRGSDFDRLSTEHASVDAAWFEVAWGRAPTDAEMLKTSHGFACVWDALVHAHKAPAPEMECLLRRKRAGQSCFRRSAASAEQLAACNQAFANACVASEAFQTATRACPRAAN
ncbi:MAG: hypothetical protein IPK60_16540 [Sandaracinaceae bacterium]|nr:hypothetical protein [Sandaracinaceae bacterium]